jgi:hypothetical protein
MKGLLIGPYLCAVQGTERKADYRSRPGASADIKKTPCSFLAKRRATVATNVLMLFLVRPVSRARLLFLPVLHDTFYESFAAANIIGNSIVVEVAEAAISVL